MIVGNWARGMAGGVSQGSGASSRTVVGWDASACDETSSFEPLI